MDVRNTFLYDDLIEDVYMSLPLACVEVDKEYMVCKLQKSICGIDPCIYMKLSGLNTYSWFYMLLFYLQLMIPTFQLTQNS